jgi:DNA phosphorothioation-dependent restriction protein DptG
MKRIALALFFMLLLGSEVCNAVPETAVDQIKRLIVSESCERIISSINNMLAANEILNRGDAAACLHTQRTLLLYLEVVNVQCIGKNKLMYVGPRRLQENR